MEDLLNISAGRQQAGIGKVRMTWARIRRMLRRTYRRCFQKKPLDLDRFERDYVRSLYREAADELGVESREVGRVLEVRGRGKIFQVWKCTTSLDSFPMYEIVEDKVFINQYFRKNGFNTPEGRAFAWHDYAAGVGYALSLGRPCVIKPAIETGGGTGVNTNLTRRADIGWAFGYAGIFSAEVLVEEFLPGDCYRFLVYKGRCLSVLRRELPMVVGDGAATVRELMEAENRRRAALPEWRAGDPLALPFPGGAAASRQLRRQGFRWDSVPGNGQRVHLASVPDLANGSRYTEVLHKTHPELIGVAERAASLLGMPIAGADILIPDIGGTAYALAEINVAPSLEIHYLISNPAEGRQPIRTILADYFACEGERSAG